MSGAGCVKIHPRPADEPASPAHAPMATAPDTSETVPDLPRSYPQEMHQWFDCYALNPDDKLGHDAILYLAETGIRRLALVAFSVCHARDLRVHLSGISLSRIGFGAWADILERSVAASSLWDASGLTGALTNNGRLAIAKKVLPELSYWNVINPLAEALATRTAPTVTWWEALKNVVWYRNRTLGHPQPSAIGKHGYYAVMTPVIASSIGELLWNKALQTVFADYPVARFDRLEHGQRYRVRVWDIDGRDRTHPVVGAEGTDFEAGARLIVRRRGQEFSFVCLEIDPEEALPPPEPAAAPLDREDLGGNLPELPGRESPEDDQDQPYLDAELVVVIPGRFRAGADNVEVQITRPFAIARLPVTQALYRNVTERNPSRFQVDLHPVESLSWWDAVYFCNAFSELLGLDPVYLIAGRDVTFDLAMPGVRLPTESEWEYACRGGHTGVGYEPIDNTTAWYAPFAENSTHPVGALAPNGLGLHDMLGNVFEWCNDRHDEVYPSVTSTVDPTGPDEGRSRVVRGASYISASKFVNAADREGRHPDTAHKTIGFRVARTLAKKQ
jgi:formylglycine-generating enzyme